MRILCIGDSNTWGYLPGSGLRLEKRWTKVLSGIFLENEIIEEGLNGRTLSFHDPHVNGRCGLESLGMILMTHQPIDLVIIMLGTNDLKKIFHCEAKCIGEGIREFIRIIRNPYICELYDAPEIFVVSPVQLRNNIIEKENIYGDFDENSLEQSKYLAIEIEKVCKTYQVNFMDAAYYAEASIIDAIHMDEENHRKLAVAMAEKIREIRIR